MRVFMAPPPRVFRLAPGGAATGNVDRLGAPSAPERRCVEYGRRERTAWAGATILSVLVHTLVVLLWPAMSITVGGVRDPDERRHARPPLQAIDVRVPDSPAAPASARPVLAVEVPDVRPKVTATPSGPNLTLAAAAPARWSVPPRPAPVEPAPGSDEGNVYVRPVALSILTNWRPRVSARGVETTVRVHTDAAGRATGLVELVPPTPSPRLNEEIASRVRQLTFHPAFQDGTPVAAWAEITLVICPHGVTATSPASPSGLADACADSVRVAAGEPVGPAAPPP